MGLVVIQAVLLLFATAGIALGQTAALVNMTDTFSWNSPSPDPSGVVFVPGANSLFIADSEVEEMPLFSGSNLFQTDLDGSLVDLFSTLGFTPEPAGITVNPANGHLFFSTDNAPRRVYELNPGADGIYLNSDDILTNFKTTDFGSTDAEGITYDTASGRLHLVDGLTNLVYTIDPGPNLIFDGVAPAGDDITSSFDTSSLGLVDPEGIAFDAANGHLYIVGEPENQLLHVTTSGQFVRSITLDSQLLRKPAGLSMGPSSLNNGSESLYLVDRGIDNDFDPTENDGRLFEFALPPLPGNQAPVVQITSPADRQSFQIADLINFAGTAIDPEDGDLTSQIEWVSDIDGAIGSGAGFSTTNLSPGLHTITASSIDSAATQALDIIELRVIPEGTFVVETRIASSSDDSEQRGIGGNTWTNSDDLELIDDNGVEQIVGLRFNSLSIPAGSVIEEANIQFQTFRARTGPVSLEIRAQASDNAEPIVGRKNNLTNRSTTVASSIWQPGDWETTGEAGVDQKTSDLTALVQEVIDRSGWSAGGSLLFMITGSGPNRRIATVYDSDPSAAALLYVRYRENNDALSLSINSPVDGETFASGSTISFAGTASGGTGNNSSESTTWESNVDGYLGAGATLLTSDLSSGAHVVTARVSDSDGSTATSTVSVVVEQPINSLPVIAIVNPVTSAQIDDLTVVNLVATASDQEDGDLSAFVSWSSDQIGSLGTGSPAVTLPQGMHTISATVIDFDGNVASDSVVIQVDAAVDPDVTVSVRINSGSDDAESRPSGNVSLSSSDLEMTMDGPQNQTIALRFNAIQIPKDAGIVSASIQFHVDEPSSEFALLEISAQDSDNPTTFENIRYDISSRPRTASRINWTPSPWVVPGNAGPAQQTPDLSTLVQGIVTRENWAVGNSLVFFIAGDGKRVAKSYEGRRISAPELTVTYTLQNQPPLADSGIDQQITIADAVVLNGSVSDDGNPGDLGALELQWSVSDGPGSVEFSDPTSLATTAEFGAVGTYDLLLSAFDGQLSGMDQLTVTVSPTMNNSPPVVVAGSDLLAIVGEVVALNANVSDDGLPGQGLPVNVKWSQLSGPVQAEIDDTDSVSTSAVFPEAGTYVLELSAFDAELLATDQITITVGDSSGNATVERLIGSSSDDAEEAASGEIDLTSTDIELSFDGSYQVIGLRFASISIPNSASITNAYVQFTADEINTEPNNLLIYGESVDNAATFSTSDSSISARPLSISSVAWSPPAWDIGGESGMDQRTPDLSSIIQEIVNRSGWNTGNALSLIITGDGQRTADSFDYSPDTAARLVIDFQTSVP